MEKEDIEYNDTVKLLTECDAGTKMAVISLEDVLSKVHDTKLKNLLTESKFHHKALGDELHALLKKHDCDDKEPNPMAKGMSWIKTNVMTAVKDSDTTIADIITDGCNMGIKSLYKYMNQYANADHTSKDICNRLISIEEELRNDLRSYL